MTEILVSLGVAFTSGAATYAVLARLLNRRGRHRRGYFRRKESRS